MSNGNASGLDVCAILAIVDMRTASLMRPLKSLLSKKCRCPNPVFFYLSVCYLVGCAFFVDLSFHI